MDPADKIYTHTKRTPVVIALFSQRVEASAQICTRNDDNQPAAGRVHFQNSRDASPSTILLIYEYCPLFLEVGARVIKRDGRVCVITDTHSRVSSV